MKCPQCGRELTADGIYCEYCGTQLEQTAPQQEPVANNINVEMQRHGFITFWLWFMAIVNPISAILNFNVGGTIGVIAGILGIVNCVAAILLLNRKKVGFWLFTLMAAASCTMGIMHESFPQSIGAVAGVAILYYVLQLRKNDQSYWSQLN